jgi:hypothetical protein
MYPLIFSGRLGCDFRKFGSDNPNERIYKCPSRVVHFNISRYFQCNNCGKKTEEQELFETKKKYDGFTLDIQVCTNCLRKISQERNNN